MVVVGGPNKRPRNPRWRTAAILKKPLNRYICNRFTDFDKIWYSDAYWPLTADLWLKFRIFENPKWRRPSSWKITKIAISPQRFDRSLWNLVRWCKMCPLTAPSIQKFEFHKSKMEAAAILKITKISISPQRFDRSLRNLVRWCKMGLLTAPTVKKLEFHKSKMADGRHFETTTTTTTV